MNLNITISISDVADASDVIKIASLVRKLNSAGVPTEQEPAPTKTGNGAAEPVSAKRKPGRPKKIAVVTEPVVEPVTVTESVPEPDEDPEVVREKFRAIAAERGVVWLRPILIHYGAERLGDLTNQQVVEALHAAA